MERKKIQHPIPPAYKKDSRILILGSFPSPKSRESGFFYGHPQNRFWKIVSTLYQDALPLTVQEKQDFLIRHHIAAWDVIKSCEITGASDSSITDVVVNDLRPILEAADIRQIYVNGKKAYQYYRKYTQALTGREAVCLPSTSPANVARSFEKLLEDWSVILEYNPLDTSAGKEDAKCRNTVI